VATLRIKIATECVALFIIILLPCLGCAQQAELRSFELKYEGHTVTIHVTRSIPLSELLKSLCQTSHTQCEGTEATSSLLVAPMTVSGTWENVLASLLEGTQLNYSCIAASSSSPGSLVIQGRASRISTPVASPAPIETTTGQDIGPSAQMVSTFSENSSNDQGKNVAASATSSSDAATVAFSGEESGGMVDPHGLPVTASSGSAIEAMPDRAGNPISVNLGGPTIEPMRDRNGNAIPVVIESQSYEPMPDKSGNLIPVNVPRRH